MTNYHNAKLAVSYVKGHQFRDLEDNFKQKGSVLLHVGNFWKNAESVKLVRSIEEVVVQAMRLYSSVEPFRKRVGAAKGTW